MSNKSKVEKYDQFQDGDEILEFTGLYRRDMAHKLPIFKIIKSAPGYEPGDVKIFEKGVFERSQYKKLPPPQKHPAVLEAARLTKNNPGLQKQFFKVLPCQDLCGQCRECSKRIWRRDNA